MRRLTAYLLRYNLRLLLLCVAAFVGIYLLIDFFEKVDDFISHQAGSGDYLSYIVNSVPQILVQVLPLGVLTATVLTLGGLGRTNEITAMRACGVSLWKIIRPLMVLAFFCSLLILLLNELAAPHATRKLNELLEFKLKGKEEIQVISNELWYRSEDKIINIATVDLGDQTLNGLVIFTFDRNQKIVRRTDADQAVYRTGEWFAEKVTVREFDPANGALVKQTEKQQEPLDIGRAPEDFTSRSGVNAELNFLELATFVDKLESEGYNATRQRVDMHNRLATPFTCLIMGFLGVPFALQKGRNSNIALGIGLSLAVGVGYFIVQSLLTALGYSGALPPVVSAWAANLLFLGLGIWLLLNTRE